MSLNRPRNNISIKCHVFHKGLLLFESYEFKNKKSLFIWAQYSAFYTGSDTVFWDVAQYSVLYVY
jgi:hypothetical protein